MFYIYILYSDTFDKFYIGQTADLKQRLHRHNKGYVKSTKPYIPWELKWRATKDTRGEAMLLEKKLKNLSRQKLKLFIQKYS